MDSLCIKCQKHPSSQIIFICLDPNCSKNRKCCLFCIDEHHQAHEIVSISKFLEETNNYLQRYNEHPEKNEIIKLLNFKENLIRMVFCLRIQNMECIKNNLISKINKIEQKIEQKFNLIRSVFYCPHKQTITSHILKTFKFNDLSINQYIDQVQKVKHIQIGSFKDMEKYLQFKTKITYQQINHAGQQTLKLLKKVDKFVNQVKFSNKQYSQDFSFSLNSKAAAIQLADSNNCVLGMTTTHSHALCTFDKPLDPINDKFFVRININPNQKVWLGACLLEVVKKSNFVGCSGYGKGTYSIDQSSTTLYSYNNPNNQATLSNHQLPIYNSSGNNGSTAGWNFKEGDILMVKLNYLTKVIGFYKINQNYDSFNNLSSIFLNTYKMPIETNTGELYPFVGFNRNSNDSVTILSRNQILKLIQQFGNSWAEFLNSEVQDLDDL